MSICLCYHDEQNFLHERGVCYGTKEKEPCSCGGNPVKCDFYEEVREKYFHRTNADHIRAMTDEELAQFFHDSVACDDCPVGDSKCKRAFALCKNTALAWLKSQVGVQDG